MAIVNLSFVQLFEEGKLFDCNRNVANLKIVGEILIDLQIVSQRFHLTEYIDTVHTPVIRDAYLKSSVVYLQPSVSLWKKSSFCYEKYLYSTFSFYIYRVKNGHVRI